ncbi:hypothetical protein VIVU109784_00620 [Vibrio vulnificus]|uniref:Uncharacterized protein n=1 Tax=Vibrio vulnificus (strain CMCP6) TaxID=216895 RepID=A0A3Q0KXS1_VIBVU|nr:hypothetical protein [Vibrio vulnificus]AAO07264.1 hypothetical protein VV2_0303 [Vibrio vulnificus CMCP6]QBN16849.1 hypothetical protein E2I22_22420 [Vibrio vulnificus]
MNKKALLLGEIKKEMAGAVEEIGAHVGNPIFGKFLNPIRDFFNSFGRKIIVLLQVQNEEIETLKQEVKKLQEVSNG